MRFDWLRPSVARSDGPAARSPAAAGGWRVAGARMRGERAHQEDAFCVWPEPLEIATTEDGIEFVASERPEESLLMVIADGMGGHAGGAQASITAVTTFREAFLREEGTIAHRLRASLDAANAAIASIVAAAPHLAGMGSTLTAVVLDGAMMTHISVGDSPLLRLAGEGLERLNDDHSMRGALAEAVTEGRISEADAAVHPQRNALISAVTGGVITAIDQPAKPLSLDPGDMILLATDGLLTLSESDVEYLLRSSPQASPRELIGRLIDGLSKKASPYQDNTTILLATRAPGP